VVCFPRSGHHAMIGFLSRISDFPEHYCEFYTCTRHNGVGIECPNKGMNWQLKHFRCAAGNRILKNHDFKLNLPYTPKDRFIVQYRHPFYSIKSWYELEQKSGRPVGLWPDFLRDKMSFWISFMKKWVLRHGGESNVLLVPYDSLAEKETIVRIAGFAGFNNCDVSKLGGNYFKSFRQIEEGNGLDKSLESEILDLLEKADIAPLFHQ
jgi:hypothetical protein